MSANKRLTKEYADFQKQITKAQEAEEDDPFGFELNPINDDLFN